MNAQTIRRKKRLKRVDIAGLTALEMLVALSLSSALILTVIMVWRTINKQTTVHTRHAIFESDANLLADNICTELKRAQSISRMEENTVRFTINNDTVEYAYDGENLLRNQNPVRPTQHNTFATDFRLEWNDEGDGEQSRRIHTLIQFSLHVENTFGDSITVHRAVAVPYFSAQDNAVTEEWLF